MKYLFKIEILALVLVLTNCRKQKSEQTVTNDNVPVVQNTAVPSLASDESRIACVEQNVGMLNKEPTKWAEALQGLTNAKMLCSATESDLKTYAQRVTKKYPTLTLSP